MIVPGLAGHLDGDEDSGYSYYSGYDKVLFLCLAIEPVDDGCYAHATPDGEGIERTCISIVTLTGLHRCLVQIDDDGETSHEEQEEHHPKLSDTNGVVDGLFRTIDCDLTFTGIPSLPEETKQTEYQGQTVEYIMSLVFLQIVGKQVLIA